MISLHSPEQTHLTSEEKSLRNSSVDKCSYIIFGYCFNMKAHTQLSTLPFVWCQKQIYWSSFLILFFRNILFAPSSVEGHTCRTFTGICDAHYASLTSTLHAGEHIQHLEELQKQISIATMAVRSATNILSDDILISANQSENRMLFKPTNHG